VASGGASAALAGLVFVAVSINIERILQFAGLPERALQTVLLLLSVVLVSIIGLIPGQGNTALGAELLGEGLLYGVVIALLAKRSLRHVSESRAWILRAMLALGTLPLIVGGASLIAEAGGGLYWTVGGILGAIAGAVANAWVLLVEILRWLREREVAFRHDMGVESSFGPSVWMFTTPLACVATGHRRRASARKAPAAGRPGSASRIRGASRGSSANS
jgi:hypothetical protein